jgi:hypothetical protein
LKQQKKKLFSQAYLKLTVKSIMRSYKRWVSLGVIIKPFNTFLPILTNSNAVCGGLQICFRSKSMRISTVMYPVRIGTFVVKCKEKYTTGNREDDEASKADVVFGICDYGATGW